jgi:cephalosporin-C deacetylase-like acetyl esterase
MLRLVAVVVLVLVGVLSAREPEKLADRLAKLDATIAPADEQKALANMVASAIQRRRQELNDANTSAWRTVANKDDWEKFRAPKLQALRDSLGQFPAPPQKLNVRVTGTVAGDGFVIENVVFESRPGWWVTANLYRPAKPVESMPGFLIVHSHHNSKEQGELQDMGMTWARAGCLVLIPDQPGHGERRAHPFVDASSYPKPYRVSRQDYFYRYDSGIQLHLDGDSLMGWMAWDLMRGVDLLLTQKGIDPKRLLLLGSVAGGGDVAAVVGAIDQRITAVVPFNFGGPSPSPRAPFPPEKEPRWNFAGGASWESTRNLTRSAADGFFPWVIVGSIAPRYHVYAHEFAWFREGDPVWARLQKVESFYATPDHLAFTHGKGDVNLQPPEATHCNNIGATHRVMMHESFRRWFGIQATEYTQRVAPEKLRCWTPEAERDLHPRRLTAVLGELADERIASAGKAPGERRKQVQDQWKHLLGNVQPPAKPEARRIGVERVGSATVERILLTSEPGITVPLLLFLPARSGDRKPAVVVGVCQEGKGALLRERAADVAALLDAGVAVCLPDVRGTGETGLGTGRGRNSSATALSSSLLMLGDPLIGGQMRDLRAVLSWLRTHRDLDATRLALWGDSLAPVNGADTSFVVPREDDAALPAQSEPLGGVLALLTALYEDEVRAVHVRGGLTGFRSVLDHHLVLIPHDVVVPGSLAAGDLPAVAAVLAPRPLCLAGLVDGRNRRLGEDALRAACRPVLDGYRDRRAALTLQPEPIPVGPWLVANLK